MKKINLEKIIYSNYLKTSLTSILFIELILIIIYFSVNNNMVNTSVDFILKDMKKNTYDLVNSETKSIEKKFGEVEVFAKLLQNEHQNFFKNFQDYKLKSEPIFKTAQNGMYYKTNNNGGSSVIVSNKTEISEHVYKKLRNSEVFDISFKSIVDNEPEVVAAYFNSFDDINRYYPFIPDAYSAYPPDIHMENYNFYYEADLKHNPSKGVKWTDVYLDPAGQGWMLSAIVPIYNKGFLEGVTGIDVTVSTFIENFLNIKLPYDGKSFILNEKGQIVAMPEEIEKSLGIKEVGTYDYKSSDTIKTTIYKASKFDILKHKDEKAVITFENIIKNKPFSDEIELNNKKYLIFSNKIEKTSWHIVSLIPEDNILANVRDLEDDYKNIGYVVIVSIIFFYILFFIYLYYKAKELVRNIHKPLLKVIEVTKFLGKRKDIQNLEECGIVEIDELNKNFNELSKQLEHRTKKLVDSESKRIISEQLANTDALTGAYNRRFLDLFAQKYMKIVKRENADLSILVADIDNFKTINDTHGHDVGDKIIKKFVEIIKNIIRDNDLVVRYGGDEFVIVLPNTSFENAKIVANKISSTIESYNKLNIDNNLFFTISIGMAQYKQSDSEIEDIIIRADKALYQAKKLGKNQIV